MAFLKELSQPSQITPQVVIIWFLNLCPTWTLFLGAELFEKISMEILGEITRVWSLPKRAGHLNLGGPSPLILSVGLLF